MASWSEIVSYREIRFLHNAAMAIVFKSIQKQVQVDISGIGIYSIYCKYGSQWRLRKQIDQVDNLGVFKAMLIGWH